MLAIGVVIGAVVSNLFFGSGSPGHDSGAGNAPATQGAAADENSFPAGSVVVTVSDVQITPPRTRIQSIGTGKAAQLVHLTADFSGTIEAIHVQPNTIVAAGDPIVTFERRTQEILLESAKAELEKDQASYERLQTLSDQNSTAISQSQLDVARAAFAASTARVAEAQYEYDRRVVRAPFSGQINLNDLTIGSYIQQGSEIVTLVDASSLFVEFSVPETSIEKIRTGVNVRLTTPALRGRVFNGSVVAFDTSVDEELRTVRVRAQVDNSDNLLVPGMTFSVSIASVEQPLPRISSVSILWDHDGAYVWRVNSDNQPERVNVILRDRIRDDVWVEADLKDGDRVIRDGAFKVSQGSRIAIDVVGAVPGASDG